jgi:hypothetical protein
MIRENSKGRDIKEIEIVNMTENRYRRRSATD